MCKEKVVYYEEKIKFATAFDLKKTAFLMDEIIDFTPYELTYF